MASGSIISPTAPGAVLYAGLFFISLSQHFDHVMAAVWPHQLIMGGVSHTLYLHYFIGTAEFHRRFCMVEALNQLFVIKLLI